MGDEHEDNDGEQEPVAVWAVQKQTNVLLMLEVLQVLSN